MIFNGDTIVTQNSNIFYNLTVGNYTVVVSDSLDCNQQLSFPIIADELIISDSLELHKDELVMDLTMESLCCKLKVIIFHIKLDW